VAEDDGQGNGLDEGLSDWLNEIESVVPLRSDVSDQAHSRGTSHRTTSASNLEAIRAAAEGQDSELGASPFTLGWVEPCEPNEVLGYKKPGIQEAVYKKLRLGGYPVQAVIDLHGQRLEQASHSLYAFVEQCHAAGMRVVRVVHGRGWRSKTEPAMLKRYCAHWLKTIDIVLAFHSAQPRDGGAGALYVLIKKNPDKKAFNRNRHRSRQG